MAYDIPSDETPYERQMRLDSEYTANQPARTASVQPASAYLPPTPTLNASAGQGGTAAPKPAPAPSANTQPQMDPMAFSATPSGASPPVNPNPSFAPPGGYGTNTAAPQANGYPAAPAGFFDAYDEMVRNAAAAKAAAPVYQGDPNNVDAAEAFGQQQQNLNHLANSGGSIYGTDASGRQITQAEGDAMRDEQLRQDALAQYSGVPGLVTKENQLPGTTYGFGEPVGMNDLVQSYIDRANSPNGGANVANTITPEDPSYITPHPGPTNTSGGSGWIGDDGQLHFPSGGEDYLVGGKHYDNYDDALAAETPGGASGVRPGGDTGGMPGDPTGGAGGGTPGGGSGNAPSPGASEGLQPNLTPVDPTKDLRSFEITPGDLVDRFKLAQQQFGSFADSTQSRFDAALRDANRAAAASGRLGSGMLRTSFGDLANERQNTLTNERDTLFQNALLGSVQDAQQKFNNYLAEQQYELGAQNQGFGQAIQGYTLQDQLTNSAFARAMQQNTAGQSGSPYDAQLLMAQLTGGQSSQALNALSQLIAAQNAANTAKAGQGNSGGDANALMKMFLDWQRQYGGSGGGTQQGVDTVGNPNQVNA